MARGTMKVVGLTIKINGDASGLKGALGSVGLECDKLGKKIESVGKSIEKAGKGLTKNVTAPIVAGFASAIKTSADFETAMKKVDAITASSSKTAEEHAEEMKKLEDSIRGLAQESAFSAKEAGDAAYYMAMAGWDVDEIYSGLPAVLDLATASGSDLATTSDIVTDAMTAFHLEADQASRFTDVLATASANANTNVDLLGESFKYVAPVAGEMNYSIEDVATALGLMANNGVKGSMAGTTLRNVIQRLTDPTKKSAEAMEYLGLTEEDIANMSLDDVMRKLRKEFQDIKSPTATFTKKMNELDKQLEDGEISLEDYETAMNELIDAEYDGAKAERVRYAAMLAGARGMPGLLAIIGAAEEDYNGLADAINNSAGSASEMAKTMNSSLAGQFKILLHQLQEVALQIGDIVVPVIKEIVKHVQEWVKKLQKLSPEQKEMLIKIAAITAAIGPLLIAIGKLTTGIGGIIRVIGSLAGLIASNPYVLLIAAIAAAVIALTVVIVKNWDKIKAAWNKGTEAVKKKTSEFITNEVNNWKKFGNMIVNTTKTAWNNLKTNIMRVVNAITTGVTNGWNNIKNKVTTAVTNIKTSVTNGFNAIKTSVSTASNSINSTITERWTLIKNTVTKLSSSIKNSVVSSWSNIVSSVRTKMFNLKDSATSVFNKIKSTVEAVAIKIRDAFRFKWELPKIKLPHFKVDEEGGLNIFGIKIPRVRVEWYKKAYENPYLFNSPTVVNGRGFGDGNGGELVYGRDALMRDIAAASQGSVTINVYASDNMNVNELADKVQHRLVQLQRQRMAVYA